MAEWQAPPERQPRNGKILTVTLRNRNRRLEHPAAHARGTQGVQGREPLCAVTPGPGRRASAAQPGPWWVTTFKYSTRDATPRHPPPPDEQHSREPQR